MALSNKGDDSTITPIGMTTTKPKMANHIFVEIRNDGLTYDDLENLHKAVLDPNKFKKTINIEIARLRRKIIRLEKMDEIDAIKILKKKNKLKILERKKTNCLRLAIEFRKEIEALKSPQDVDAYIDTINEHIYELLNRPSDENNPIIAEKYSDILEHALNQFLKTQKNKKNKSSISLEGMPLLSLGQPEPIIDWEDARFVVNPLKKAIDNANRRANTLLEFCIHEASKGDENRTDIIRKKYKILDSMRRYARISKINFSRRQNFSNALYSAASICKILSNVANFTRAIPGANLIANGVSKTFEFLSYTFLTISQAADPNVARTNKLAARRHFEVMKNYNITETALASGGTLSLAVGLIAAAAGAAPIIAPILFVVGGLTLTVSNIISAERNRKEVKWLTSELNRQYGDLLSRKDEILSKNVNELATEREKAFYRDAKKIESYKLSYKKKISESIGSALATSVALGVLLTIAFPPAGLVLTGTVFTTLAVVTTVVSLYSLYQGYREKKNHEQFKGAENAIEKDNINTALENGNRLKLVKRSKPEEGIEIQETQEIQPAPKAYTPSFDKPSDEPEPEPRNDQVKYPKPD